MHGDDHDGSASEASAADVPESPLDRHVLYLGSILQAALSRLVLLDPLADVRVYPLAEAAKVLNMSPKALQSYCGSGDGRCIRNGRRWGLTRGQMATLNEGNIYRSERTRSMTSMELAIEMSRKNARRGTRRR